MDLLLCELKLGASARVVLQDDGDSRGLVDYEPGWVNGAGDHDVVVVAPGAQVGQQRQRRQEYSEPGDVGEPEQQTADEQRQAGCQECTAAGGEYAPDSGPRLGHVWVMSGSRGPGPCRSVRCGRNGYSPDDVVDDIGAGASGHLRLTGRDEAMGQYGLNQRLNIIGQDMVTSCQGGITPGRPKEVQAGARGSAQPQSRGGACCRGEVNDVLLDGRAGVQLSLIH